MDFEEKLLKEVRSHEIIYNLQDKQYRQIDKKDRIWMDIARHLNTNVDMCRKKWKNLRDTYKKLRRQDFLQSGNSAPEVKRKWRYLELLSFLDEYGVPRPYMEKRADDEINKKFVEFVSVATTNIAEACKVQPKDSTSLLFESLAAKINKANIPEDAVNEIEAALTAIAYNKLADHKN